MYIYHTIVPRSREQLQFTPYVAKMSELTTSLFTSCTLTVTCEIISALPIPYYYSYVGPKGLINLVNFPNNLLIRNNINHLILYDRGCVGSIPSSCSEVLISPASTQKSKSTDSLPLQDLSRCLWHYHGDHM